MEFRCAKLRKQNAVHFATLGGSIPQISHTTREWSLRPTPASPSHNDDVEFARSANSEAQRPALSPTRRCPAGLSYNKGVEFAPSPASPHNKTDREFAQGIIDETPVHGETPDAWGAGLAVAYANRVLSERSGKVKTAHGTPPRSG
jgi:hypothetical protein